jgi:hypothetical protein
MHVARELTRVPASRADVTPLRTVGAATLGPALLGGSLGLKGTVWSALFLALALPTVIAGVAMLMSPALYIGMTMQGDAPEVRTMTAAIAIALRDTGIVLLGLAMPVAFLVSSAPLGWVPLAVGASVVCFAVAVGLCAIHGALFRTRGPRAQLLFAGWSIVGLAIGARLLASVLLPEAS